MSDEWTMKIFKRVSSLFFASSLFVCSAAKEYRSVHALIPGVLVDFVAEERERERSATKSASSVVVFLRALKELSVV